MKTNCFLKVSYLKQAALLAIGFAIEIGFNPVVAKAASLTLPNGVASGDTTQTSTVLWTHSTTPGNVSFQYSTDPNFSTILGTLTSTVTDPAQPVKVQVAGLNPGTNYFYRAIDASGSSASGKFYTSQPLGTYSGLRFGVAGDWRGELAPYPAIANVGDRNLEFFLEFGDTIYADFPSPALPSDQARTLDEYRTKHNEVYSTRYGSNTWADLRASTSVLSVIDDHEVTDNFAGGAPPSLSDPRKRFDQTGNYTNETNLFKNGLQAFQEYNPIRDEFYGNTGDPRTAGKRQLYRYNTYGSDAATFLLDQRSFRDAELPPVTNPTDPNQVAAFLTKSFDPTRTLLGQQQLADLKRDLLDAQKKGTTWKFIFSPEPIQNLGVLAGEDHYEGYAAERADLLRFIQQNGIENAVFTTADFHGTLVNNITYQNAPFTPQIPTNTWEIITGPVAFDAPLGPTVVDLATALKLLTPAQKAYYDSLPIALKDEFVRNLVDNQLKPLGYDPIGLQGSGIDATLLKGGYVAANTYGWTEFDIDPKTQQLLVTTYGIEPYTQAQMEANPSPITSRTPSVISQFAVNPKGKIATSIPEPNATISLLAIGAFGICSLWQRRRKHNL